MSSPIQLSTPSHAVLYTSASGLSAKPNDTGAEAPTLTPAADSASVNIDPGQAIAAMLIDSAFARRKTAREARDGARASRTEAQKQELNAMAVEADKKHSAELVAGWTKIGVGLGSLASVGLGALGEHYRNEPLKTIPGHVMSGLKPTAEGMSDLFAGSYTREAATASADAKRASNAAQTLKEVSEDWSEDISAAKETVRKALDFIKDYQSALSQAQSAAMRRA
jgi:hypothetical protein